MTMPNTAALLAARRRKRSFYPVQIKNSILLDGSLSSRLSRAYSVLADSTISVWVKRGTLGAVQPILGTILYFDTDDTLRAWGAKTIAVFRDCTSWYHISASNSGIYVNGVYQDMSIGINTTAFSNAQLGFDGGSTYFSGYLADFILTSGVRNGGVRNGGSAFGQFKKGVWIPKRYSGSYGAEGCRLKFADAGQLGLDSSGNGNNFTVNGSPVQSGDTPTNNHCVMSSAVPNTKVSFGGLATTTDGSNSVPAVGSCFVDIEDADGWSFTFTPTAIPWGIYHGIIKEGQAPNINPSVGGQCVGQAAQLSSGEIYYNGTSLGTFGGTMGTEVGVVMEYILKNGGLYIRKNGVYVNSGNPVVSGLTGKWTAWCNAPAGYTHTTSWDFGQLGYAPSVAGCKALCAKNLPDSDAPIIDGREGFETQLWAGSGVNRQIALTAAKDIAWVKNRTNAEHHWLFNSVLGNLLLKPSATDQEGSDAGATTVSGDVLNLGTAAPANAAGSNYAGWLWRKGAKYGVDILAPGAQSGPATFSVAHNLGAKPELIILKSRTSSTFNWFVTHKDLGTTMSGYQLNLNTTSSVSGSGVWGGEPTSTHVYYVVDNTNGCVSQGDAPIIYLFRSIPGFSKVFSYTGNGNADGPFVNLGFKPAFVMLKNINYSVGPWGIRDLSRSPFNDGKTEWLDANSNKAEYDDAVDNIEALAGGFKVRSASTGWNGSSNTIIGIAFAANPFKYANAV